MADSVAGADRPDAPDRDTLLAMFEIQSRIKLCDERFRSLLTSGQIQIIYYSPRGQECISAGWGVHLRSDDQVVTIYRGLHDHLAKGVPLRELWAEFLGRATGTSPTPSRASWSPRASWVRASPSPPASDWPRNSTGPTGCAS
jgi:TPP-dependent pyruvate/acetoin dehydrogenase alpha subunit